MTRIKMTPAEWAAFQAKMAKQGKTVPSGSTTRDQNIKTNYTPTGPAYQKKTVPDNQQIQRDIRSKARSEQRPTTANKIRKIGRAVSKAIGTADRKVQGAGRRYIEAETKEVPKIRKDSRESEARVRKKIAPDIDMSSSWVMSPHVPTSGWLTGSRGNWSTLPESTQVGPGLFGFPSTLPRTTKIPKSSGKKKKSRK
jgi:hypothetical protein